MKKKRKFLFLQVLLVAMFLFFLPGRHLPEIFSDTFFVLPVLSFNNDSFEEFVSGKYPEKVNGEYYPEISAESAFVFDTQSGKVFYDKNPDKRMSLASITKLMTALVAVDYYSSDKILTVKRLAPVAYESDMGLSVGEQLTVKTLLYGLLVPSGNDAAYIIADNYPGGIENFIYAMNKKAENLDMKDTHFENPSGFDAPNQYSTARDIASLSREVLKNGLLNRIVATYGITLSDVSRGKSYSVKNVNQFLGYLFGADGVKTGTTDLAGQCLVASVSRNDNRIIAIVLKSTDRFGDSGRLIEWAFRNFRWITPTGSEI